MKKRAVHQQDTDLCHSVQPDKLTEKEFRNRMIVSLLTILACITVMISSAFAFFYTGISTHNTTIRGAHYAITVNQSENQTFTCPLTYGDTHRFFLQPTGTATTGYCKVQVGERIYYTDPIPKGTSFTLTIRAAEGTIIRFTPQWGTPPEDTCGEWIAHSVTPYVLYTVEPTAKLSDIAAHYGVSMTDILVYNNLSAVAAANIANEETVSLPVGTTLRIPGVSKNIPAYAVPFETYRVEPTATLTAIAAYYDIPEEDILAFNGISSLTAEMTLKIPHADPALSPYAVPYVTYVVEPTATIAHIAAHYRIAEVDILLYNNISEITVGQPLRIPGRTGNTTEAYAVPYALYIVEAAARPDAIAAYYGVSLTDIMQYNQITELTEGETLKIPGVSPDTPPYAAPTPDSSTNTEESETNEGIDPPQTEDSAADNTIREDPTTTEESTSQKECLDSTTAESTPSDEGDPVPTTTEEPATTDTADTSLLS